MKTKYKNIEKKIVHDDKSTKADDVTGYVVHIDGEGQETIEEHRRDGSRVKVK